MEEQAQKEKKRLEEESAKKQVLEWFKGVNKMPGHRKVAERAKDTNNPRKVVMIGLKEMKISWRALKRAYNLRKVIPLDLLTLYELLLYLKVWALEKKKTDIEFPEKTVKTVMSDNEVHVRKNIDPRTLVRFLAYSTNRLIRKARKAPWEKRKQQRAEEKLDPGKEDDKSRSADLKYDRRFLFC